MGITFQFASVFHLPQLQRADGSMCLPADSAILVQVFLKFRACTPSEGTFSLSPPLAGCFPPSPTSALTLASELLLYPGTWRCFAFLFERRCLMVSQGLWTFLSPKSFIHLQPFVYSACDCRLSAVCDFDKAQLGADEWVPPLHPHSTLHKGGIYRLRCFCSELWNFHNSVLMPHKISIRFQKA